MFHLIFCLLTLLPPSAHGDLVPVHKFLKLATSQTLPHPSFPQLRNHYYLVNPGHKTALVFLPGMGESGLKYHDLYEDLHLTDVTFYSWDHIGQGFSSHLLQKEITKTHIDSFDTYLVALQSFLKSLRQQHSQVFVLGHSMGAHLGLRLAAENPNLVDGLIMTSPLFDIHPNIKPGVVLNWFLNFFSNEDYPPLYSFFVKKNKSMNFVTNSVARQNDFQKTLTLFPEIKRQGATLGWVRAASTSIEKLKSFDLKKIQQPVLLLQAETEYLVDNTAQDSGCAQLPHCQKELIKNSKHEILFELDPVRNLALEKIRVFIKSLSETNRATNL